MFLADTEGLTDVGDSANMPVQWDLTPQMLEFGPTVGGSDDSERARGPVTAGKDWTVLFPGIPAGATITDVNCTAYNYQRFNGASITSWRVRVRIVDSAGVSVHSAGDLGDTTINGIGTDASKVAGTVLGSRVVDAAKQASSTVVALEVQVSRVAGGIGNDFDVDDIAITITYTVGGGGTPRTVAGSHSSRRPFYARRRYRTQPRTGRNAPPPILGSGPDTFGAPYFGQVYFGQNYPYITVAPPSTTLAPRAPIYRLKPRTRVYAARRHKQAIRIRSGPPRTIVLAIGPIAQAQSPSFTRAVAATKSWTQTQTLVGQRAVGATKLWAQAQLSSFSRAVGHTFAVVQAQLLVAQRNVASVKGFVQTQALTLRRDVATSKSWTQAQTSSSTKSVGKSLSTTQAQALTSRRSVSIIKSWTQAQAISFITQLVKLLTLSWTQAQSFSMSRAVAITKGFTQSQAMTLQRNVAGTRAWTQAQALSLTRAITISRAWSQAQVISFLATLVRLLTLVFTQASGLSFTRAVTTTQSFAQAQALVARRAIANSTSWTQGQLNSFGNSVTITRAWVQAQAMTFTRAIQASKSWAQAQVSDLRRDVGKTLSWAQAQILTFTSPSFTGAHFFVNLIVTQAQSVSLKRSVAITKAIAQGSVTVIKAITVIFITALPKIILVDGEPALQVFGIFYIKL